MPDDRFLHPRAGKSEKVSNLTDLEFRVWVQYILSSDDFGVMPMSALVIQADNYHLANRPQKVIQRCLETLAKERGLLHTFVHQGRPYLFQHDWQTWQRVEYPRATNEPRPPAESLAICDEPTQQLFGKHPGGKQGRKKETSPNSSQIVSEIPPTTRAGAPAKRLTLTANGSGERLTAEGGPEGDPPMDVLAREFLELYPAQGRCASMLVEPHLFAVLSTEPASSVFVAWEALKRRLAEHVRSHQWRVKGMIPRADRYLRDGIHLQELPEHPPSTLISDKTARTLSSAAEFIKAGERGPH